MLGVGQSCVLTVLTIFDESDLRGFRENRCFNRPVVQSTRLSLPLQLSVLRFLLSSLFNYTSNIAIILIIVI